MGCGIAKGRGHAVRGECLSAVRFVVRFQLNNVCKGWGISGRGFGHKQTCELRVVQTSFFVRKTSVHRVAVRAMLMGVSVTGVHTCGQLRVSEVVAVAVEPEAAAAACLYTQTLHGVRGGTPRVSAASSSVLGLKAQGRSL